MAKCQSQTLRRNHKTQEAKRKRFVRPRIGSKMSSGIQGIQRTETRVIIWVIMSRAELYKVSGKWVGNITIHRI